MLQLLGKLVVNSFDTLLFGLKTFGSLFGYIGAYFLLFPYNLTWIKIWGTFVLKFTYYHFVFSGHEVGRLLLEVPHTVRASRLTKKKIVSDKLHDTGSERQETNFGSGISRIYVLEDSCLMKKVN